ncbi:hypothetical protein HHI36_012694 [Cryptolaemus montrouzieri]|uniref:PHD-type domain-containing protein n=1 Tax=Cryptolaemus montrouzieri TaxID=559131 RepID=A0ABD2NF96_9CUCU
MTPDNIINGFKATGNSEAIHESAFAPSLPSQRDIKRSILNNSPTPNTQDQVLPDYDTHLSSDEDDMTLAVIAHRTKKNSNHLSPDIDKNVLNTSFEEMLPTPLNPTETVAIRKKALNYIAQQVTKDLFNSVKSHSSPRSSYPSTSKQAAIESWFCVACQSDDQKDMRMCVNCNTWYHEECVGLEEDDTENFECC